MNVSSQEELKSLRKDKDKAYTDLGNMHYELNDKILEVTRLQMESQKREDDHRDDAIESLKRVNVALVNENDSLKMQKHELEDALKISRSFSIDKEATFSESFPGNEEIKLTVQKLEGDLNKSNRERDKAIQQLARLKQHLLDKESDESRKMDEDSKIIEELEANNKYQKGQILHLENALKQVVSSQAEIKMTSSSELQKFKDTINGLNKKLEGCMNTINAKNIELLNLQTALGQYYAEIEVMEHLERNLASEREASGKILGLLKDATQQVDVSKRETEEVSAKLSQTEQLIIEVRTRSNKLEEDNAKLRRALEQSMTRLNRMSIDSDYFVDRRIVIKLLVTYFQRNHSKEVLDLMVRMLGFSDEDKQRIGLAQQDSGKGAIRGVLGLPGRLVGGIMGGSSNAPHAEGTSENQSFADLWVDFLLKENEERERRESMAANGIGKQDPATSNTSINQSLYKSSSSTHRNSLQPSLSDSEFSTVPLTSSESLQK